MSFRESLTSLIEILLRYHAIPYHFAIQKGLKGLDLKYSKKEYDFNYCGVASDSLG